MRDASHDDIQRYPIVVTLPVQWGDQDAIGHVNNIIPLQWFESARIRYFEQLEFQSTGRAGGLGFILAATHCNYRLQITYPDTVHVGARVVKVGKTSMTFETLVVSEANGGPSVDGRSVVVMFDYPQQEKRTISDELRAAIVALEATANNSF